MSAMFRVVGLFFFLYGCATISVAKQRWCVAKSHANTQALQAALDYACGAGADCEPLAESGPCFEPDTVVDHASYAFNSYYQRNAQATQACSFGGTGHIVKTDPSHGDCQYPSNNSN